MNQLDLFSDGPCKRCNGSKVVEIGGELFGCPACGDAAKVEPCDPNVADEEKPRLRGQNGRILARLKRGPATNDELSAIARKYTSRISDLRAAGYRIVCFDKDGKTGVTWYGLEK